MGPLLIAIEGTELTAAARERLEHPAVGGVVLFAENFADPGQLRRLTAAIRGLREPPLLIGVDQEGGRVQRFRAGFTRLPAAAAIGRLYDRAPERGRRAARLAGWLAGAELRGCGVDLDLAPVLDLQRAAGGGAIGDRAWHAEPERAALLAEAWVEGARRAGVAAVAKHFPGHGSVAEDSHSALPYDTRPVEAIIQTDLLPFRRLVASGVPALMAAHVVYPQADDRPAGYSRYWLERVLRRELGFRGAVLSDDLGMAAAGAAGGIGERVEACLAAGCDAALVCRPELVGEALDASVPAGAPASARRLARLHGEAAPGWEELRATRAWRSAAAELAELVPSG